MWTARASSLSGWRRRPFWSSTASSLSLSDWRGLLLLQPRLDALALVDLAVLEAVRDWTGHGREHRLGDLSALSSSRARFMPFLGGALAAVEHPSRPSAAPRPSPFCA